MPPKTRRMSKQASEEAPDHSVHVQGWPMLLQLLTAAFAPSSRTQTSRMYLCTGGQAGPSLLPAPTDGTSGSSAVATAASHAPSLEGADPSMSIGGGGDGSDCAQVATMPALPFTSPVAQEAMLCAWNKVPAACRKKLLARVRARSCSSTCSGCCGSHALLALAPR
jgi:hypothetical protein